MMLTPEQLAELRGKYGPVRRIYARKIIWLLDHIDAKQARIAELEDSICRALGGPCYMDMPDGGSVKLEEQLQRMSNDAARYNYIASACTVILLDGTECEDQRQLDSAMQSTWPEDASDYGSRIAVIGQNGNDGLSYKEQK